VAAGILALACLALFQACSGLGAWDLIAKGSPSGGTTPSNTSPTTPSSNPTTPDTIVCKRRMRINLNGICSDPSVTGFPLLVRLSAGNKVYDECSSTEGLDIRFKDKNLNSLPFEIESWNKDHDSYIWVKVDFSSSDDYIYIYFKTDSSDLIDRSDPAQVWSNGYVGVWHGKPTALLKDSGTGSHDGSSAGYTSPTSVTGQIGSGLSFFGSDSGFAVPGASDINDLGELTIEAYVYENSPADNSMIFSKGPLSLFLPGSNKLCFSAAYQTSRYVSTSSIALLANTKWKDIAVTWTGSTHTCVFYSNGSANTVTAPAETTGSYSDASSPLVIGNDYNKASGFAGYLDEMRISNVARSSDWIKAQFNAQDGSNLNFEAPQDAP